MKSLINLVVLTPGFAADEDESSALPYLQFFLRKLHTTNPGINIHIIALHYPRINGNYKWNGINVFAAGGAKNRYMKIFLWLKVLLYLHKFNRKKKIDLIHAFWLTDTTLIGLMFRLITGVPILSTAMGQDVKKENKYLWFIRFFKFGIIAVSDFQIKYLPEKVRGNLIGVVPFGIDESFFSQKNVEKKIDILGVGSLNKIKNYLRFIKIVKEVIEGNPNLVCGIAGEGTERKSIEELIMKYGLESQVKLYGQLSYEEVIKKIHECKILLHTAEFEGQSLVIIEALAAGAYVVCYPVGIAWNIENIKLRKGKTPRDLEQNVRKILFEDIKDYSPEILVLNDVTCREYKKIYQNLIKS